MRQTIDRPPKVPGALFSRQILQCVLHLCVRMHYVHNCMSMIVCMYRIAGYFRGAKFSLIGMIEQFADKNIRGFNAKPHPL